MSVAPLFAARSESTVGTVMASRRLEDVTKCGSRFARPDARVPGSDRPFLGTSHNYCCFAC
jgi:hypothetical protein